MNATVRIAVVMASALRMFSGPALAGWVMSPQDRQAMGAFRLSAPLLERVIAVQEAGGAGPELGSHSSGAANVLS